MKKLIKEFKELQNKTDKMFYKYENIIKSNRNNSIIKNAYNRDKARMWEILRSVDDVELFLKELKKEKEEQNKENLKLIFDTIENKIDNYIELVDDIEYFEKFIDGIVIYFSNGEVYQIFIDIDNKNNNNNSIIVLDENINILYNSNDINYIIDNVIKSAQEKNHYINNSKEYIQI